ncbi:hypothetical protein CPJCM30710_29430 [Clostridium polyendosporum]|uniref:Amine oxidase domain-containing protein n=1 Tax=Clostridium polyendosporum TaxID=69208 RepID=A0A919S1Y1_9CLOT|nr:NAD(P)/FAD-dependent oxidoreductase [Clostridium polyendosporum]GIM30277.1 hypothetical protein CPJCM30710_29430 [Clostridium polyendosporum]
MKKIIIVGAGIGGLSAGIYGLKAGFDAEIYEMHTIPGGECTGWNRGGYHFDSCIHWLTGTKKDTQLYKMWCEVGALDNVEIYNHDYFTCYEKEGKKVYIYRDIEKLRTHLLDISPEDKNQIEELCNYIKRFQTCYMPADKPQDMMSFFDLFKMIKSMKSVLPLMSKLNKITVKEYLSRFKSSLIRGALSSTIIDYYSSTALFFTLSTFTADNGGWPRGGSLAMSKRMSKRFEDLGGKITYGAKVRRIIVENNTATGIELLDGRIVKGDYIISATDADVTLSKLLQNKYKDKKFETMYSNSEDYPIPNCVQVSLGVNEDLSHIPHCISFSTTPFDIGGKVIDSLGIKHYCYEPDFAPNGKSVINCVLTNCDYDFWKKKRENISEYKAAKAEVAEEVMIRIVERFPELLGKFEVIDVTTPVTYERYCGAYRGAWMSFAITPKGKFISHSGILKGLNNFYMAGQWTLLPGGLPSALVSGKFAVQRICK